MKRKTLRRLIALVVLGLLIVLAYKQVVPFVKNRFFTPKSNEVTYTYQLSVENRLQHAIGEVLQNIYGNGAYFVSVVVKLQQTETALESKRFVPKTVSSNVLEKTTYESISSKNQSSADGVKKRLNKENARHILPGLVKDVSYREALDNPLPGFPAISTSAYLVQKRLKDTLKNGTTPSSANANQGSKDVLTKEKKRQQMIYDELFEKTSTPSTLIDRLFVSVVVDTVRFEERKVPTESLQTLIENMAGVHLERGDQVIVQVLPIKHAWFDFQAFYWRHKPVFDKIQEIWNKVDVFVYGLLGLGVLWLLIRQLAKFLARRKANADAKKQLEKQKEAEEQANEEKVQKSIFDEKRDAVLQLAKDNPADVASLLKSWAEKES